MPPSLKTFPFYPKPGESVEEFLIKHAIRGLDPDYALHDSIALSEENPFAKYDTAIEFGEKVLGEQYTADVQKMMRSVMENPVTLAQSANSTGKSHGAARAAIHYFLKYPDAQVYLAAAPPEANLKRILFGQIGAVVTKFPKLFQGFQVSLPSMQINRHPLSYITGVTIPVTGSPEEREAKFSGKHAPHILFIIDEGDAVPPEVYKGIESCISGGSARLLILFNPRYEASTPGMMQRGRRGVTVQLSALRHPNVREGEDIIPGAVTREATVRRINEWTRPAIIGESLTPKETFQVPDFLIGAVASAFDGEPYPPLPPGVRKIVDASFSYMVLGEYPAVFENQLIPSDKVDAAVQRWKDYVAKYGEIHPRGIQPVLGYDVADLGNDFNCVTLRYKNWVPTLITWGGVSPDVGAQFAAEIYRQKSALVAGIDANGVGASVPDRMAGLACQTIRVMAQFRSTKITELGGFDRLRDQLWWDMAQWIKGNESMIPPDEILIEELKAATYQILPTGNIKVMTSDKYRELLGRSPDRASSLVMTFAADSNVVQPTSTLGFTYYA